MHDALLISEIVREICAGLDPSSLSATARTCRTLHDPALDELWRDLFSLYPFVRLLTLGMTEKSQEVPIQSLASHQWAVLRKYSARTRSLYACMIDDMPYPDRYLCLSNPPDPDSLFPNLQIVAWYPDNHLAMLPFLRLLCGPALTSLSAEFAIDPTSLAMLGALGTLCPNIVSIAISAASTTLSNDLADALSTSICHWNNLKRITCDDLTISAVEHIGCAMNLESLTACAAERMSSFPQPVRAGECPFSRLRYLHLYSGLFSTASTCLRGLRLSLEELRLDLSDAEEVFSVPSSLKDLFTAVAEACSHASLTKLYFCVIYPRFPPLGPVFTISDARPLLSFSNLRVLSLDRFPTFAFDDDDIAELASAWPAVEDLALSTYATHPTPRLPTVRSLIQLIRLCPKLRSLSLVLDATTTEEARRDTSACHDVSSDVLDQLCLGNAPVDSPIPVARMLHRFFPSLTHIDLSVWNKEPLNRLSRVDRCELRWGMVNVELHSLREGGER